MKIQDGLLILPGVENNVRVIEFDPILKKRLIRFPSMRFIYCSDEIYELEFWVNNCIYEGDQVNTLATISANILGEIKNLHIYGQVIVIRKDGLDLNLKDWSKILDAVFFDHELIEQNIIRNNI